MSFCLSASRQLRTLGGVFYHSSRTLSLLPKEPFKLKPFSLNQQSVILPGPERIRGPILVDDPSQPVGYLPETPDVKTVYQCLQHGLKISNDGPCVGTKRPGSQEYIWSSYSTVISRSQHVGSGLIELGIKPKNDSYIGIFAKNCEEFLISLYTCAGYSMVLVPLYLSLGLPSIFYVINHAKLPVVITTSEQNTTYLLSNPKDIPTLKMIVSCEEPTEEHKRLAKSSNIKILTFSELEELGKANKKELVMPDPSDVICIPFTSGTTGVPKGAMITHQNAIALVSSLIYGYGDAGMYGGTLLSYLPPAHIYEICNEIASLYFARGIIFYTDDIKNIMTEVRRVKPAILPLVPRLLNLVYMEAMKKIKESKIKSALLPIALWHKERLVKRGKVNKKTIWDKYLFKHFQAMLGEEAHLITTTSAPIPAEIIRFYSLASGSYIHEAYGSTEVMAAVMTLPGETHFDHVGGPTSCNVIKLVDVPDMGYFSKDDCGEICVKGNNVFKGYLNNPDANKEALKDGWFHTGDVGKWLPNGSLKIIDRKKHLFKLSQGEYIAPEKVENAYKFCNLILQILVDGIPEKDYVIALIVPEPTLFKKWLVNKGYTQSENLAEILASKEVRRDFLSELHKYGKNGHLNSLEQARNIAFLSEPFTIENDLMTPTFKIKRNVTRKHFQELYQKLYKEGPLITSLSS